MPERIHVQKGRYLFAFAGIPEKERFCMDKKPQTAFQRSRVYELLSYAFGEPSDEFIEFAREGGLLASAAECLSEHPVGAAVDIRPLTEAAEEIRTAGVDGLAVEYEKLTSPKMNFLYECNYHAPLTSSVEMADVAGFYRAFGLDFPADRPDHVSMELEFMRIVTLKEAKALMDGDGENAGVCISAQKSFLSAHLGRWSSLLSQMTEGILFYGKAGRFLSNWIAAELRYLSVEASELFYHQYEDTEGETSDYCIKEATHEGI
jgi:hypothetical protein